MRYSSRLLLACLAVAASWTCLAAACSPPASPRQDAGDAAVDAAAEDEARSSCSRDCAHLRALGCPAAADTPHGGTCEAVCANEVDAGVRRPWACRSAAKSCPALDACR